MRIKVKYIKSEYKAKYSYYWSGVVEQGWMRPFRKYRVPPTYGVQFKAHDV